jgi:ATP-dependent phosphoenolpyruvate carboxykinase
MEINTMADVSNRVHLNPTTAQLVEIALLRGEGQLTANGALVAKTGERTGRSPNDRFIVKEANTEADIEWGKVNRPFEAGKFSCLLVTYSSRQKALIVATKTHGKLSMRLGLCVNLIVMAPILTRRLFLTLPREKCCLLA